MGASLVAQVLARWTHVSDRAFRVLVRMAVTALDKPKDGKPANIYHGGRELLAMALRTDGGSADTRYRAVKRAVAELSEAGAIQHIQSGWAGRNAVYRLTLGATDSVADDDPEADGMGGLIDPPEGGLFDPPNGGPVNDNKGGGSSPPKEHEDQEDMERAEEKAGVDPSTTSHPPRENDAPIPTSDRCPNHHIRLTPRFDGMQPCPLCRKGVPASDPPVAPVIDLNSRRAS